MPRLIPGLNVFACMVAMAMTLSFAGSASAGLTINDVTNYAFDYTSIYRSGVFTNPFNNFIANASGAAAVSDLYTNPGDAFVTASAGANALANSLVISMYGASDSRIDARATSANDTFSVIASSYTVAHFSLANASTAILHATGFVYSTATSGGSSFAEAEVYIFSDDGLYTPYYFNYSSSSDGTGGPGFDDTLSLVLPAGAYQFAFIANALANPTAYDVAAAAQSASAAAQLYNIADVPASVPEPASLAVWTLVATVSGFSTICRRKRRSAEGRG